jgi:hypothetical protein
VPVLLSRSVCHSNMVSILTVSLPTGFLMLSAIKSSVFCDELRQRLEDCGILSSF